MSFNYSSRRWLKKKEHILLLDGYVDQVALMYGRREPADTVHHIYPIKDYPEYAYQDWNLMSVSLASHNKLENRKTGKLTKLGEAIKMNTRPGVNWRAGRFK